MSTHVLTNPPFWTRFKFLLFGGHICLNCRHIWRQERPLECPRCGNEATMWFYPLEVSSRWVKKGYLA